MIEVTKGELSGGTFKVVAIYFFGSCTEIVDIAVGDGTIRTFYQGSFEWICA